MQASCGLKEGYKTEICDTKEKRQERKKDNKSVDI